MPSRRRKQAAAAAATRPHLNDRTLADLLLVEGEDPAEFQRMVDAYMKRFRPDGLVETHLVEQMIAASWRVRRVRLAAEGMLDDPGKTLEQLDRLLIYEERMAGIHSLAMKSLARLKKNGGPGNTRPAGIRS